MRTNDPCSLDWSAGEMGRSIAATTLRIALAAQIGTSKRRQSEELPDAQRMEHLSLCT